MRRYCKRGHNHTHNQIIVRCDDYKVFKLNNKLWIKIPSLISRKRIVIPLNIKKNKNTPNIKGNLRIILRDGILEVHYFTKTNKQLSCGNKIIGLDKGYDEVFYSSDGKRYGCDLKKCLDDFSDKMHEKNKKRNKLYSIAKKDPKHKKNIFENNLGKKKKNEINRKHRARVRNIIYNSVHEVFDDSKKVIVEDLTRVIKSKKIYNKKTKRRLNSWTKGIIAQALQDVSHRRGSTVVLVNCAYTSQMDSRYGVLLGQRNKNSFYCFDGEVLQADQNAALNILARYKDSEISLWTSYKKVRSILLERTECLRLRLSNQDTSL